jgi:hypothetical protein
MSHKNRMFYNYMTTQNARNEFLDHINYNQEFGNSWKNTDEDFNEFPNSWL